MNENLEKLQTEINSLDLESLAELMIILKEGK